MPNQSPPAVTLEVAATKYRQSIPLRDRPPFLTTKVGMLKTVEAMREALEAAGVNVSDWASEMMARSEFSDRIVTEEQEVQFVEATVRELGEAIGQDFSGGATIAQIYAAARQLNWETCEASDAINVRLATLDQEKGWMYVSTDPGIPDSNGVLSLFRVGRRGGDLWLGGYGGYPGGFYYSYHRFVFRRK